MGDQSWQDTLIKSANCSPMPCLANAITTPLKATNWLSVLARRRRELPNERRGSHSEEAE
jgi:hypothetical protein